MLGSARDKELGKAGRRGDNTADKRAGMTRRLDVAVIAHSMACAPDQATFRCFGFGQDGVNACYRIGVQWTRNREAQAAQHIGHRRQIEVAELVGQHFKPDIRVDFRLQEAMRFPGFLSGAADDRVSA